MSASSTLSSPPYSYPVSAVNDGDRKGLNAGYTGNWHSSTATFPQWVQVDFNGSKTIGEVDVFSLQDNYPNPIEPTETTTFTLYGLTGFDIQYWTGSAWATVPGGSVTGNNKVWKKVTFAPLTTSKIRVLINATADNWSRMVELEAWTSSANISWLVTDHLGTPRMILDQTGSLANVKRHDYLPFGEELFAPSGGRTIGQGYASGDGVRQQFTQKERDVETELDYFGARYYASTQGRFTNADPLLSSGRIYDPMTWNRYSYTLNNPLRYVDPAGLYEWEANTTDEQKKKFREGFRNLEKARDSFRRGSAEYNKLDRSLKAYGSEGVANGVTVKFGATGDGSPAATAIGLKVDPNTGAKITTATNPTGQDTVVTFDPTRISGGDEYVEAVGHEGSHVADGSDLVSALPTNTNLAGPAAQTIFDNLALNLGTAETEMRAYEVSSNVAQARGLSSLSVGRAGHQHEIWNSGWREADRPLKRYLGICGVLSDPNGYYRQKIQEDIRLIDQ